MRTYIIAIIVSGFTAVLPISANDNPSIIGLVSVNHPHQFVQSCFDNELTSELTALFDEINSERGTKSTYDISAALERLRPIKTITLFVTETGPMWQLTFADQSSATAWLDDSAATETNRGVEQELWSWLGLPAVSDRMAIIDNHDLWIQADAVKVKLIKTERVQFTSSRRYRATELDELKNKNTIVKWYFANPAKSSRGKKDAVGLENFLSLSGQIYQNKKGGYVSNVLVRIAQPADKAAKLLSFGDDLKTIEPWVPRNVLTYSTISLDIKTILQVFYEDVEGVSLSKTWPFVRYMHLFRALTRALGREFSDLATKYCTGRISWIFCSTKQAKVNFQSMATCCHVRSAEEAQYAVQWLLKDAPFSKALQPTTHGGVVIAHQNVTNPRNRVMNLHGAFVDVEDMPVGTPCRDAEWCYFALGKGFFMADSMDIAKACIDTYQGKKSSLAKHGGIKAIAKQDQTKGLYAYMLDELFRELLATAENQKVRSYFGHLVKHSTKSKVEIPTAKNSKALKKVMQLVSDAVPNIIVQVQERSDGVLVKIFGS